MTLGYIVRLQPGCWLAPWSGDPGRTLVLASARVYRSEAAAKGALTRARKIPGREFRDAAVVAVVA